LVGFEDRRNLLHAILGISGEAGEVADSFKKTWVRGQAPNKEQMIEELGDLRWYIELACDQLGTSMEEVEKANIEKLRKRYPGGFK
jgi:NTP pyrophosphatase (non-canonical NTP hydrolase)